MRTSCTDKPIFSTDGTGVVIFFSVCITSHHAQDLCYKAMRANLWHRLGKKVSHLDWVPRMHMPCTDKPVIWTEGTGVLVFFSAYIT